MAATDCGLTGDKPTAAVDGTALESRHTSAYFVRRAGSGPDEPVWTSLTVAFDSHIRLDLEEKVETHFAGGGQSFIYPSTVAIEYVLRDPGNAYVRASVGGRFGPVFRSRRWQARRSCRPGAEKESWINRPASGG